MRDYFNQMILPLSLLLCVLYLGYHTFSGKNNILYIIKHQKQIFEIKKSLATLQKKNSLLIEKINWLHEKSFNFRFIEVLIYNELGLVEPGTQIIQRGLDWQ